MSVTGMWNQNRSRVLQVACGLLVLTAACGTRVDKEAAAGDGRFPVSPAGASQVGSTSGADSGAEGSESSAVAPAGGTPVQGDTSQQTLPARATAPPVRGQQASGSPAEPGRAAPTASSGSSGRVNGSPGSPSPAPAPTPGSAPIDRAGELVVLGNVGTYSGPIGSSTGGVQPGLQVWAQSVNDGGGLLGRPVKVISVDDGGDPARSKAVVQDLVENRKAIALIGNTLPLTIKASRGYLEERHVPVVGGDLVSADWNESPVFFPQGTSIKDLSVGLAKTMVAQAKEIGILDLCRHPRLSQRRGRGEAGREAVRRGDRL